MLNKHLKKKSTKNNRSSKKSLYLTLVLAALLGVGGYLYASQQKDTNNAAVQGEPASQSPEQGTTSTAASTATPVVQFVTIKEYGVKFPTPAVAGLKYEYGNHGGATNVFFGSDACPGYGLGISIGTPRT
jgi:hypothetical protein